MHNLHSFVELDSKPKKAKPSEIAKSAMDQADTLIKGLRQASSFMGQYKDHRSTVSALCESVTKDMNDLRKKVFESDLTLPEELVSQVRITFYNFDRINVEPVRDHIRNLSASPKSTTDAMRSLADALGMVIIPAVALNPQSVASADYYTRNQIHGFEQAARHAGMDSYVVCPVSLYDVMAHASDTTDGPVASYSKRYESVMMAISMQIPMFRSIMANVKDLDHRVTNLESMVKNVRSQVATLQAQVDRLQDQVDRETKQRALQEAVNEELRAQIRAMEQTAFRAVDPMLFAVRKGVDLMATEPVVIGPAWGPDLPEILVTLSGLTPIKSQRAKLKEAMGLLF